MPILNALRLSQINEVLDHDKNINKRAYEIGLKNKQSYEGPQAYSQLNAEDIGAVNELVSVFKLLLEKKINEIDKMIRSGSTDIGKNSGLVEDVVTQRNRIISIYLIPANTSQTKTVILTAIIKTEEYITEIESLLLNVLDSRATNTNNRIAKLVFLPCPKAYIVYDLIQSQLRSQHFTIISNHDLDLIQEEQEQNFI
jgi:hypothetical protein